MDEKIELMIQSFLEAYSSPFDIGDIMTYVGISDDKKLKAELISLLTSQHLAFYDPISDKFLSRSGLFTKSFFSIHPTRTELIQSILFIGHRCIPFVNPDLFPHQIIFLYKNNVIPHKTIKLPTDIIYEYYYLFGDEYVPQLLTFDNEDNNSAYRANDFEEPEELNVTVLDMSAIYWDLHIEYGDRFCATIIDWLHGIIELSYVPSSSVKSSNATKWEKTLEQGFLKSFEIVGPTASMEEQVLYAFLIRFELLINNADCSLEEFMRKSKKIDIVPYGVESRFWRTDEKIPVTGNWANTTIEVPRTGIEELFWNIGFSLPEYIIEAYIRDAFFQHESPSESILSKLISDKELSSEMHTAITKQLEIISNRLKKKYNWFRDQKTGELRTQLIALHAGIGVFIHRLDMDEISIDDLPETPFIILSQLLKHVCSAIDNLDSIFELDDFNYETLSASIEGMEESFFEVKTQILDSFDDISKNRFTIIDTDEKNRKGICLSVEFNVDSTKRKSIREIVVPAKWTLAQLYPIICASCGIRLNQTKSFTTTSGTILIPETVLELIMNDRIDTIMLVLQNKYFCTNVTIAIKSKYRGPRIMPFCEYTTGKNAGIYEETDRDIASETNILQFPGTKIPDNEGTIPSAEEITSLLQQILRNAKKDI